MLESAIEAGCCAYAVKRGLVSRKLQGGPVGDPDRVFFLPDASAWFVEFKTADGRLSPRQRIVHMQLQGRGQRVTVIRSLAQFKKALDVLLSSM